MDQKKKIKIDSVLNDAKHLPEDKNIALQKLNSVKSISEKFNYRYDEILYHLAVSSFKSDNLNKAIYFIEKCIGLKLQIDKKDRATLGDMYSFYGNILDYIGDYATALEVLNKAAGLQVKSKY